MKKNRGIVTAPPSIQDIILKILNSRGKDTIVNDIWKEMLDVYKRDIPRTSINTNLSMMTRQGKIIRVRQGGGRYLPAIYKAKPHE